MFSFQTPYIQPLTSTIHQGFFPRVPVKHTNAKHVGQVYINFINWLLAFLCIVLVIAFQTSTSLGQAYGALSADAGVMCVFTC